jgi:hypothetical protein
MEVMRIMKSALIYIYIYFWISNSILLEGATQVHREYIRLERDAQLGRRGKTQI